MKIALVNAVYPIEGAMGGIPTYMQEVARMLAKGGEHVEVFTSSKTRADRFHDPKHLVHVIRADSRETFRDKLPSVFEDFHNEVGFDVLEAAEWGANALHLVEQFPELPFVEKLHAPTFLVEYLNHHHMKPRSPTGYRQKVKEWIKKAIGRKQISVSNHGYNYRKDPEYRQSLHADMITSPSKAVMELVQQEWPLDDIPRQVIPNPFNPDSILFDIPISAGRHPSVGYLGRLEIQKGIVQFEYVIPEVCKQFPETTFTLVGPAFYSPEQGKNLDEYLQHKLRGYQSNLLFKDPVPRDRIHEVYANSEIFVFPSYWENFPYVCLEAMAAGRAVVASKIGGMAEMIDHKENGMLADPANPEEITKAVNHLLKLPEERKRMAKNARLTVKNMYCSESLYKQQLELYAQAISYKKASSSNI